MKRLYKIGIILGITTFAFAEEARFTRQNDVVMDNKTKLEWIDDESQFQDPETGTQKMRTWQEAIDYCERRTFDGKNDWRVPNINELKTIIDYGYKPLVKKENGDEINPLTIYDIFENTGRNNLSTYGSSTSTVYVFGKMFVVVFDNGEVLGNDVPKTSQNAVYYRCVRSD